VSTDACFRGVKQSTFDDHPQWALPVRAVTRHMNGDVRTYLTLGAGGWGPGTLPGPHRT